MKILFVCPESEHLGIEIISAVAKNSGHQTDLILDPKLFSDIDFNVKFLAKKFDFVPKLIQRIKDFQPDLIAFSVVTDEYLWACKNAKIIKENFPQIPIIFGGIHVTSVPERVIKNEFIDFIVVGEGEYPFLELVNNLNNPTAWPSIKNLYYKKDGQIFKNEIRPLIANLDELPLPDKDLFYKKLPYLQSRYPIMTSRGCPFACTFCCNNLLRQFYQGQGTYLRRRSPDDVMKELIEAVSKYDIKEVIFYDDSFILDKEWLNGFLQEYKEKIKKPFHCYSIAKYLTPEVIELLKNCGYCAFIEIGIQSVNDKIRREICNRQDDNEQIAEVARQLHQAGIEMLVDHIIGFPGEGGQSQIEAAKFYNRIRPNIINSFWLTYYPKLKIVEISQKYGLLSAQDVENIEEGRFKFTDVQRNYNLNQIKDIKEIRRIQTLFNIIPFLPVKFNNFLINKKIYRLFPTSNFFRISMKKILLIVSRKKYRIAAIKKLKRYFYFLTWRKI